MDGLETGGVGSVRIGIDSDWAEVLGIAGGISEVSLLSVCKGVSDGELSDNS